MADNHLDHDRCCSNSTVGSSSQLKVYQFFMFCVPIFFTFILLFLFYLFYIRPRRVNWSSLGMRTSSHTHLHDVSRVELGLKKEVREMLPIIIYKESFSVRDSQCSVCLGDYEADDRLQQIPACGHTFHIHCIDLWLTSHTTCPLCRLSLLCSAKSSTKLPNVQEENNQVPSVAVSGIETSPQQSSHIHEQFFESRTINSEASHRAGEEDVARSHCVQHEKEGCKGQVLTE